MEILKAVLLGIIQGATEFLPISSSGHLVISSELLSFEGHGVVFDVFLHLGTLVSVCIFFRQELVQMIMAPFRWLKDSSDSRIGHYLLWDIYVIVATIPAVIVGLFFKDHIENSFSNILIVYTMLAVTGVLMVLTTYLKDRDAPFNGWRVWLIGCAQAVAILPGLSRSGSTIFMGMMLGVNREKVARFSFIMSIPAILGAVVLQASSFFKTPPTSDALMSIGIGSIFSAITGYFAIVLLLDLLRKNRLQWFGYYCLVISAFGFVHHFIM